jgi:hypothetical protein
LARPATDALLRAAAARACGGLHSLDVTGCTAITHEALRAVAAANAGALRALRACGGNLVGPREVECLLRAAPRLAVCEVDVLCRELALARRLLRNEAPLAALHMRTLLFQPAVGERDEATVLALAADLTSHAHLQRLQLHYAPLNIAAALDAVVDAVLTRRLTRVTLHSCYLSPDSMPALARLVGGGALAELVIHGDGRQLLDIPTALALGNALRASSTLTTLLLRFVKLWRDIAAATALLGALTGHVSLRSLDISYNRFRVDAADQEEAGAALGALVAANAPALTALDVSFSDLRDAGLRPLFDALPANAHLRTLNCGYSDLSDAFARDALLPAVRANSSLRELHTSLQTDTAREAEALVRRRARAA